MAEAQKIDSILMEIRITLVVISFVGQRFRSIENASFTYHEIPGIEIQAQLLDSPLLHFMSFVKNRFDFKIDARLNRVNFVVINSMES